MPVVVLTTTRRLGRANSVVLTAIEHQGRMFLVAGGDRSDDRDPAGISTCEITVAVVGQDPGPMTARMLSKTEEAVWPVIVARYKGYVDE